MIAVSMRQARGNLESVVVLLCRYLSLRGTLCSAQCRVVAVLNKLGSVTDLKSEGMVGCVGPEYKSGRHMGVSTAM